MVEKKKKGSFSAVLATVRKCPFKVARCRTDNAQLRRIPSDVRTRGSITGVGLISGFIIFAET